MLVSLTLPLAGLFMGASAQDHWPEGVPAGAVGRPGFLSLSADKVIFSPSRGYFHGENPPWADHPAWYSLAQTLRLELPLRTGLSLDLRLPWAQYAFKGDSLDPGGSGVAVGNAQAGFRVTPKGRWRFDFGLWSYMPRQRDYGAAVYGLLADPVFFEDYAPVYMGAKCLVVFAAFRGEDVFLDLGGGLSTFVLRYPGNGADALQGSPKHFLSFGYDRGGWKACLGLQGAWYNLPGWRWYAEQFLGMSRTEGSWELGLSTAIPLAETLNGAYQMSARLGLKYFLGP
jgi:hypothetical protein